MVVNGDAYGRDTGFGFFWYLNCLESKTAGVYCPLAMFWKWWYFAFIFYINFIGN